MNKIKYLLLPIIFLILCVNPLLGTELVVDDFNDGKDPSYLGGNNAMYNDDGNGVNITDTLYNSQIALGGKGYSWCIAWDGVAPGNWGAIAVSPFVPHIDVSSYDYLTFWIYSPNVGTKAMVIFKDSSDVEARFRLTELVNTGPTWQQVSIPLEAVKRKNYQINLASLKEFIFFMNADEPEYDAGGGIYIDDIKFMRTPHAPGNTITYNGGDAGLSNIPDMPGDAFMWYNEAVGTHTVTEMEITILPGYAASWVRNPRSVAYSVETDVTRFLPFSVKNDGNTADFIYLSTSAVSGDWPARIYLDRGEIGVYDTLDVESYNTVALQPDSTEYFLLAVDIPANAVVQSSTTIEITAKTNNGQGTDDNWPSSSVNDDTITSDVLVIYDPDTNNWRVPPGYPAIEIVNKPPEILGVLGGKIILSFNVVNTSSILTDVSIWYSYTDSDSNVSTGTISLPINDDYFYSYDLKDIITDEGTFDYKITVINENGDIAQYSDSSKIQSEIEETITSGEVKLEDGNPDDGYTYVLIPEGAMENATAIRIKRLDRNQVTRRPKSSFTTLPSVIYEFGPEQTFKKPVTICLLYPDYDSDGMEDNTGYEETSLKIFFWDGYDWVFVGGTIDADQNTITVKVMHFSQYAVFPSAAPSTSDYRPVQKIITPALIDDKNDYAEFPAIDLSQDFKIYIYDINGRRIKTLENENIWRGDDDNNDTVESGVYIYQYKVNINGKKELISGTITVAK
ncbi:MAG: gliding motility-associated C-terminal domain-containing protein [Endomicrobiales bacterium]|nr:gliding motility-associated C-terminal domain-containing protein [Endomicrobiales bacterium]